MSSPSSAPLVLQCAFIAHPADAVDRSQDFHVSAAFTYHQNTTAEDVVRDALQHATVKLQATLEGPPQRMVVLVRHNRQLYRLPIGQRLLENPVVVEVVRAREQPVLVLTPPDRLPANVASLTQPADEGPNPHGFTSFVRHPGQPQSPPSRHNSLSLSRHASSASPRAAANDSVPMDGLSPIPTAEQQDEPSPTLVRHASAALSQQHPQSAAGSPQMSVPLTLKVIHFSMFGERAEIEVPYMSEDPASSIVATAVAQINQQALRFAIPPEDVPSMGFFYRRKNGEERRFAGDQPLPLPKSVTKTPVVFLGRLPPTAVDDSPVRRSTRRSSSAEQSAAKTRGGTAGAFSGVDDESAALTPASELPSDQVRRESCIEAVEAIRDGYSVLHEETEKVRAAELAQADVTARREELLKSRTEVQSRWTECAAVTKDIERLSEQVEWFEREIAEQRTREADLRAKLHKLEAEGRNAGLA